MALGPGRYGANAEAILKTTDAEMCVVMVIGGREGGAFDVACEERALAKMVTLPALLRELADNVERELGVKAASES